MEKKYELLKERYIEHEGRTLYRIRALKDFGNIKTGDIGGYIQSEDNLSHKKNCWVYDDAKVYDNACIYDNAKVFRCAEVYNYAKIRDDAEVNGNAKIYGCALLYGDAYIYENDIISAVSMPFKKIFQYQCKYRVLTAILTEDNEILYTIGCQINITEEEFVDRIYNTHGGLQENPYREEYLELIPAINLYLKGGHNND